MVKLTQDTPLGQKYLNRKTKTVQAKDNKNRIGKHNSGSKGLSYARSQPVIRRCTGSLYVGTLSGA